MKRYLFVLAFVWTAFGIEVEPKGDHSLAKNLVELLERRFDLLEDAAKWKWNNGLTIRDSSRRASIHYMLVDTVSASNIDPKWANRLVEELLNQSENYQHACFKRWREEGISLFSRPVSLRKVTDPKLDDLTKQIFILLKNSQAQITPELFKKEYRAECLRSKSLAKEFFLPLVDYFSPM